VGALGVAGLLPSKAFVNTGGTAGESGSLTHGWYIVCITNKKGIPMNEPINHTETDWDAILAEEALAEQAFEELAAFGEGATIVNVLTGERWTAGKRQRPTTRKKA